MKVLVLGGSGLLGARLVQDCLDAKNEIAYTYNSNKLGIGEAEAVRLDATDYDAVERAVLEHEPDVVINAIAHPSVDFCETEKISAYRINVAPCEAAAVAARDIGSKLVFLSSAFVFGNRDGVVTETDVPDPISYYGVLKLAGEQSAKICPDHLIVRTDQIFGWAKERQKKSFVEWVFESLESGKKLEICEDWWNRPTYVNDLSSAILGLVAKERVGTYHVVGSTFLNRLDWARRIARVFGEDETLVSGISSSKLNLPAKRPKCDISNLKVQKDSGARMLDVDSAMKTMKESKR